MAEEQMQGEENVVMAVRRRCPLDGEVLIYLEKLTEFPMFSGWECPECGFFEIDF